MERWIGLFVGSATGRFVRLAAMLSCRMKSPGGKDITNNSARRYIQPLGGGARLFTTRPNENRSIAAATCVRLSAKKATAGDKAILIGGASGIWRTQTTSSICCKTWIIHTLGHGLRESNQIESCWECWDRDLRNAASNVETCLSYVLVRVRVPRISFSRHAHTTNSTQPPFAYVSIECLPVFPSKTCQNRDMFRHWIIP
jgi:hypothetical protein